MKCLIVDDNPMARLLVKQMLSQFNHLELVGECENPVDAINFLKVNDVDLIFLDVEMPKMTGIEFLKSVEKRPLIILITAKPDYAVEAFEYNVVDYLVSPINEDRFLKAINKAEELFKGKNLSLEIPDKEKEYIFLKDKSIMTKVKMDDILFLQALGDYVTIHTKQKKFTVRLNLRIAEEKLNPEKFMRVHRSYIVAVDHVDSIEENTLNIGGSLLPISESYRGEFLKRIDFL